MGIGQQLFQDINGIWAQKKRPMRRFFEHTLEKDGIP
jgi:hypothetical protein